MDYGVGARYMAMGGAGRTIANDANAGYWNPALLPHVGDLNFSGMTAMIMGTTQYNHLAISVPLTKTDVIAASYMSMGMDALEIHSSPIVSSTPEGYFSINKSALMLSYGKKMNNNLNLGVTGKFGMRKVYQKQDAVLAFDLGAFYDLGDIQFGGNIKNAYATMMGDQTDDKYEMDIDLGASMKWEALLFSLDVARIMRKDLSYYAGVEYSVLSIRDVFDLKLRGGANSNEFSLGIGAYSNPVVLDYAFLIREMSQEHLFSFGLAFNDYAKNQDMLNAEKWYRKAMAAVDVREYEPAKNYTRSGLKEYKDLFVLKQLSTQLDQVSGIINQDLIKDENGRRILNDALQAYLKQDWDKALDNVEYLVRKYGNKSVAELRTTVEETSKRTSKYKGKDILAIHLEDAMGALMVDDLKTSIKNLEELLYYEPTNLLALKRLGSNYYVANEGEKAVEIWRRVLILDPSDDQILEFVKKAGMGRSSFTKINGISKIDSEKVWDILVGNGILSIRGVVTDKFKPTDPNFNIGLPAEYASYVADIVRLIQITKQGTSK